MNFFSKLIFFLTMLLNLNIAFAVETIPTPDHFSSDQYYDAWDEAARRVSNGRYQSFDALARARNFQLDSQVTSIVNVVDRELGNSGKYDEFGMLKKTSNAVKAVTKIKGRTAAAVVVAAIATLSGNSNAQEVEHKNASGRFDDTNPKADFNSKKWAQKALEGTR